MEKLRPKNRFTTGLTRLLLLVGLVFVVGRVWNYELPSSFVNSVSFSPDGKTIAVGIFRWMNDNDVENHKIRIGGIERTVKLIDAETGEELLTVWHATYEGRYLPDSVSSSSWVQFSPDGSTLAIGTWTGDVLLWDVSRQQVTTRIRCPGPPVWSVEFSPDGRLLAVVNRSGVVVWRVDDAERLVAMSSSRPASVAFSADASKLVIGGRDCVDVSNVETGHRLQRYYWDASTGEMYSYPGIRELEETEWVAISANGATLAVTGYGDNHRAAVKLLNLETGEQRARIDCSYGPMRFSSDGSRLAVGGQGGLQIIDPIRKTKVKTLRASSSVRGLDFSPTQKWVAAGDIDSRLTLWDYKSGQERWSVKVRP